MRLVQMIKHRYLPITVMLAVLVSSIWALPAGATQIQVNGGVGLTGINLATYGPDVTSTQPSLSGSANNGGGFVSSSGDLAAGTLKVLNSSPDVGSAAVEMRETIHIVGNIASPVTGILRAGLD